MKAPTIVIAFVLPLAVAIRPAYPAQAVAYLLPRQDPTTTGAPPSGPTDPALLEGCLQTASEIYSSHGVPEPTAIVEWREELFATVTDVCGRRTATLPASLQSLDSEWSRSQEPFREHFRSSLPATCHYVLATHADILMESAQSVLSSCRAKATAANNGTVAATTTPATTTTTTSSTAGSTTAAATSATTPAPTGAAGNTVVNGVVMVGAVLIAGIMGMM